MLSTLDVASVLFHMEALVICVAMYLSESVAAWKHVQYVNVCGPFVNPLMALTCDVRELRETPYSCVFLP